MSASNARGSQHNSLCGTPPKWTLAPQVRRHSGDGRKTLQAPLDSRDQFRLIPVSGESELSHESNQIGLPSSSCLHRPEKRLLFYGSVLHEGVLFV
jgi:hypothetical protein